MNLAIVLAVAAMLTGRPGTQLSTDMTVCPDHSADFGCADLRGNVIHMRPYLAAMLTNLDSVQPYQAAAAVYTFAHEARHVRGTMSERVAERWAIYHAPVVARLLGASPEWVARMRPWVRWWTTNLMGVAAQETQP